MFENLHVGATRLSAELQILLGMLSPETFRNIRRIRSAGADQLVLQSVVLLLRKDFTQSGHFNKEGTSSFPALQILECIQLFHPWLLPASTAFRAAACRLEAANSQPSACNPLQSSNRQRRPVTLRQPEDYERRYLRRSRPSGYRCPDQSTASWHVACSTHRVDAETTPVARSRDAHPSERLRASPMSLRHPWLALQPWALR